MTAPPALRPETGTGRCRQRSTGPGAPRMLLLHGLGSSPAAWDRYLAGGVPGYEVWDATLPWHGLAGSAWTRRCDPGRVVADLANGRGTDAGQPFDVVVAHSYAAGLLLSALAAGLLRIGAAVLVSPFYRADPGSFDWPTISAALNDFHLVFVEALRLSRISRFPAGRQERLGRQLRNRVGPYGWMSFFQLYLDSPFLALDGVRTPVLVVRGDDDIASPLEDSRQLVRALPDARLARVAECGHFPMVERPEQFALAVGGFLASQKLAPHLKPELT
ncbi:MAG TPA: alpha/beta hydrolase [Rugosimonospora sp.]|nr:alpha/beta hydrolase [Rugosimonospora sp.]